MKLIKITNDHYIVVNNSEIKEGDWAYQVVLKEIYQVRDNFIDLGYANDDSLGYRLSLKITHSTKPLDNRGYWASCITHITLQEVKELIGEVDKAFERYPVIENDKDHNDRNYYRRSAYYQALEDNKEKKYTEEDLKKIFIHGKQFGLTVAGAIRNGGDKPNQDEWFNESIQSLQSKKEWEVEFIDGKLKLKQ